MLYEYESIFFPIGPDRDYMEAFKQDLQFHPTEDLEMMVKKYEEILSELRTKEPARKRHKKRDYRFWVQMCQDYLEKLRILNREIENRKSSNWSGENKNELY